MLGWDTKWSFLEQRFVRQGRVIGTVVIGGLFRTTKGTVAPSESARALGLAEQSPAMPECLRECSQSCDNMRRQLRAEEEGLAT